MRWFADPHWRGPRPTRETVFEVSLVGDERRWRVLAAKAIFNAGVESATAT
jgi:hypothetical protein